jgi:hypothetical protein
VGVWVGKNSNIYNNIIWCNQQKATHGFISKHDGVTRENKNQFKKRYSSNTRISTGKQT